LFFFKEAFVQHSQILELPQTLLERVFVVVFSWPFEEQHKRRNVVGKPFDEMLLFSK
jgi:hypothetical protein